MRALPYAVVIWLIFATIVARADPNPPEKWSFWLDSVQADQVAGVSVQPYFARTAFNDVHWADQWMKVEPIDYWNEFALSLVLKYRLNPLRASRVFTFLNVVQHDVLILLARHRIGNEGRKAALHTTSASMLAYMFPLETPGRTAALGAAAVAAFEAKYPRAQKEISQAQAFVRPVISAAISRARTDRADEVWDARTRPTPGPEVWQAVPPLESAQPQEALAGTWRTWVLRDSAEIQPPPPPAAESSLMEKNLREVLEVSRNLTNEQKKIAEEWHLDQGSVTPPGVWNLKAKALAEKSGLTADEKTRMYAALNVAMMDAAIACWRAKYTWWTPRPMTKLRETMASAFLPHLITPPHPSYVSGHASVSGAASEVLKKIFPASAEQLDAWAEEAAMSRLYGGIHYRHDNEEGLVLGRKIGQRVAARL